MIATVKGSGGINIVTTTVLVIDDDESIRDLVIHMLPKILVDQLEIIASDNANKALLAGLHERAKLIIVDDLMPLMSGLMYAVAIKEAMPSPPPIVLMAAAQTLGKKIDGFDLVIHKPFGLTELQAIKSLFIASI